MKSKTIKIALILSMLTLGFLVFGLNDVSVASNIGTTNESLCKVTISSFNVSSANGLNTYENSTINITATVQRNGCAVNGDLRFDFYALSDNSTFVGPSFPLQPGYVDHAPHPDTINVNYSYNLSSFSQWDHTAHPGQLSIYMVVDSSANSDYGDTQNSPQTIQIWGDSAPAAPVPNVPSSVNMGSNLNITYSSVPSGATGTIYVNDQQHYVQFSATGNIIAVNQQNGFSNGSNSINIVISDASGLPILNQNYPLTVSTSSGSSSVTCKIDSDCTSAGTGPNGWNYICNQGKCVEDINLPAGSHCVPNQSVGDDCAGTASCDSTTNTCVVDEYGCQAGGTSAGVWSCSPDQSLQATCGSSFGPVSPAAKCGCTDAAYNGKTCNNGKTSGGTAASTAAAAASTGQTGNSTTTLINPIGWTDNLTALLINIMKGFLGIIGAWAVAFIVFGGFKMVISSGNEEAVLSARKTITWAILGLLIAVLSFAIIAIVQNLIGVSIPANTTTTTTTNTTNQ